MEQILQVKGNCIPKIVPPLKKGGKMVAQHSEVTKIYHTKISRDPHMKSNPKKYIRIKKNI